jgi:hypothetical protein
MPVQLRVDDYPYTKPEEAWRHTPQAFAAFDDCIPVRYLLGVIPGNLGPPVDDRHSILRNGKIEVGMHGINHTERFLDIMGGNEFGAVLPGRHLSMLRHGASIFETHKVDPALVYMPPRNVIDERTVEACRQHGFLAITAGPETAESICGKIEEAGMTCLLSLPPLEYGRSDELLQRGAVKYLYDAHERGFIVTLGLHWTWESNIGLGTLVELVGLLRPILRDFDV